MEHLLICGKRRIGKSTLICKLLQEISLPRYGFYTKKLEPYPDGFHPIYIHPAWQKEEDRVNEQRNCIGTCNRKIHNVRLDVFNTLGAEYIRAAEPGGVIVMDELGFMEAEADGFVQAVRDALDGTIPVIAAVKDRPDVEFLNSLLAHPNCRICVIDENNRDETFEKLLPVVRGWEAEAQRKTE